MGKPKCDTDSRASDVCPKCHRTVMLRLVEGIHPPMHTDIVYTCPFCGQETVTVVRAVEENRYWGLRRHEPDEVPAVRLDVPKGKGDSA